MRGHTSLKSALLAAIALLMVSCGYAQMPGPSLGIPSQVFPSPAAGAEEFANLEGSSYTWTQCDTSGCSGSVGTGTHSLTQSVTCPLGSNCLEVTATPTGNGEYNVLSYLGVGCGSLTGGCAFTGTEHFILDEDEYFVASSGTLTAIEIDPDDFDGTDVYEPSIQADSGTGHWRMWDESSGSWKDTGYSCTAFLAASSTSHHIQMYGEWDRASGTYTLIDLT